MSNPYTVSLNLNGFDNLSGCETEEDAASDVQGSQPPGRPKTTQSVFGGNPCEIYLGTGAQNKAVGVARAREDRRVLKQTLKTNHILKRLEELSILPVTIEVRVRDTPLSGSSYAERSRGLPNDETVTLCRADYNRDPDCLFYLLVGKLSLDQWGKVEASSKNQNFDAELFPYRSHPYESRSVFRDQEVARERCRKVLREYILEIKNWQELLEQGPEPEEIDAPWFNDSWCITIYRTLKLSN